MEQLINAGVAINAPVKVCRVPSSPLPWEELSSNKYTVSNNIANIPIGIEDFNYYYTLTVNNAVPPNSSGFKNPQPRDLLYKFSKLPPANINEGWCSGHVGIYVGERYNEEEEKPYNVIEALLGGVTRSYHSPISEFGGNSIYLGAREPEGGLSHQKRNLIIAFAEGVVGTAYATIETVSSMFWAGLGRGELVKGDNGKFNCVGLAEKAYELVGIDLVSNYDEGNVIHGPYHILTPAEQWYKTVPATGISVQNTPPKISNLEITPEGSINMNSSVSIICTASDEDGDSLAYTWTKTGGTFEGSTSGPSVIWKAPNTQDTYKISCKVIDNYGGEDSKSVDISVGDVNLNHAPVITSTAVTSATKDELYSYDVNATDSDGDTLIYSLTTNPSGMTINSSTGLISWTPTTSGDYNVTVKVSDGELSDTQSFTVTVEENGTYALRDIGPAGGYIFYDKGTCSSGWRYLEAAPVATEWTDKEWGSYLTFIGGTEQGIGTGQSNTTIIVAWLNSHGETDRAAQLCDALVYGGYSDWFLPSREELKLMYVNLHSEGVGGFASDGYWSSSEDNANIAWGQLFVGGYQNTRYGKTNPARVRAVRAF